MLVARDAIAGIGPAITYVTAVVAPVFATFLNFIDSHPINRSVIKAISIT
jgi:hypothetical protein